jgi:hypothetical protein
MFPEEFLEAPERTLIAYTWYFKRSVILLLTGEVWPALEKGTWVKAQIAVFFLSR